MNSIYTPNSKSKLNKKFTLFKKALPFVGLGSLVFSFALLGYSIYNSSESVACDKRIVYSKCVNNTCIVKYYDRGIYFEFPVQKTKIDINTILNKIFTLDVQRYPIYLEIDCV